MNPQLESVIVEMEKAVRGKRAVIEHMLCALLAGGHILLGRYARAWAKPRWPSRSPAPSI